MFTWSEYSHVEFVLPNGYLGSQALLGGVKLRPFNYAPNYVFVTRYVDCSDDQAYKVIDYAMNQIGKPYDFAGILGLLTHRDWRKANSWFCSEFVAASLEKGGIYLFRLPVDRVTPGMLFELEAVHP